MIVVVRKNNIVLITLIFLLAVLLYSLNIGKNQSSPVTGDPSSQKVVLIDAGHGGEDPGAVSDYSGIREKEINLNIAFKLKELLENDGYKTIMTRTEDKLEYTEGTKKIFDKRKQDLTRRKQMMDEGGAHIAVSIHLNKFTESQYYGAQAFYPPGFEDSKKLAVSIQSSLKEIVDPNNKREALPKLVNGQPIMILRNPKTTTAVVECGFLSNPDEDKKLGSEEYQSKLALAIKDGIDKYFGK